MPPITDQASLEYAWRSLVGRLGFDSPQLWVLFLEGDRMMHLINFAEAPADPTPDEVQAVVNVVDHLSDDPRFCAFMWARPGTRGFTAGDLAWARGLSRPGGWPVHVANDVELRVVAPDDLAA